MGVRLGFKVSVRFTYVRVLEDTRLLDICMTIHLIRYTNKRLLLITIMRMKVKGGSTCMHIHI